MLILFLYLTHFLIIPVPLRWERSSQEKTHIHLPVTFDWLKKKMLFLLRTKLAYFGLFFICSFLLNLLCACFPPFRLFWVICWHNLVRSLEFEETWTPESGTQRFCLSYRKLSACSASNLRHNIFRHQFAKQVGCEYPTCHWFVDWGASLSSSKWA